MLKQKYDSLLTYTKHLSLKKKIFTFLALIFTFVFWFCLPEPLFNKPTSFILESTEGDLLNASIASDGQWRFPQSDTIPEKFKKCIIAFEDKRFYQHPGVDIIAVIRALKQNFKHQGIHSGASTLNMQIVRLAKRNKRTYFNKIVEAIQAIRLGIRYSKEEILKLYAANAPFGTNVVGLDAAAWRYFGRDASMLSWGETAALAVLPNSPSLVHPGKNRDRLIKKRNHLIDLLYREKILDATEAMLAKAEPVPDKPFPLPENAPHLLNLLKTDYHHKKISVTRIKSTVKSNLQKQVTRILNKHHHRLLANQVNNCSALVVDVESGAVLAYIGNIYQPENVEIESHVDVIQAPRSPGSTLKPLLYAAMLNEGILLPNSLVPDIPTQIAGYQPNNYDLGYDGVVPASKALARSLNVPAVRMLQQYRYEKFHSFLKSAGLSTLTNPPDFYGLSLILGGCETTMWELAGIYASMARTLNHFSNNKGKYLAADWHLPLYQQLKENKQKTLEANSILNASSIFYTFEAMNEVMRPGEELVWKYFTASQQIAWKTGTSFGFRDAWAIGVTPKFVVAVWAGNTDGEGRPGLTGIDAAGPILFDIFRLLPPPAKAWFDKPEIEMKPVKVCIESGFKASELCSQVKTQLLPPDGSKTPLCTYHQLIHLDQTGQYRVSSECVSPSNMVHKSWFVLPPAMEYYYKAKNYSYRSLPPFRLHCVNAANSGSVMELIYPKNNAKIYVPKQLDGARSQVIFNAAHRNSNETVYWHLDNQYIGTTREIHQLALNPHPGRHLLTLIDQSGNKLQQSFVILNKEED